VDRLNPPPGHHARVVLRELGHVMRLVAEGKTGGAMLDFGAGPAPYRGLFRGYVSYVTADLPGESADLVVTDGRVPAPDSSFDAVLSTQVLEHVPDPDQHLWEAHRLLDRGGTLILSTHGIYWYHPGPQDFWRWTAPGLRRQIERCGFEVMQLIPVVSAPAAALNMFFQYVGALVVPYRLHSTWHFLTQPLVAMVNRLLASDDAKRNDAALFVVVARRRDQL
jgi:SAM-dependent methyltransferase